MPVKRDHPSIKATWKVYMSLYTRQHVEGNLVAQCYSMLLETGNKLPRIEHLSIPGNKFQATCCLVYSGLKNDCNHNYIYMGH